LILSLSNDGMSGGLSLSVYPHRGWQKVLTISIELSEEVL